METKAHRRTRGTGSLHQFKGKSKIWWLRYYVDGRRIEESSGTPGKAVAIRLLQRRIGEAERGDQPAQELKKLTYESIRQSLLDQYAIEKRRSLRKGRLSFGSLIHLDAFFGGRTVAQIKTGLIRKFILGRQKAGAAPATINRSLALLRRMMRLAMEDSKILHVPEFPRLEEAGPRRDFVAYEQFQRLLGALPAHLHPLVLLLFWSGMRIGEAQKIDWTQVDLDNREIIQEGLQSKSGQPRIIPMPDELVALLKEQPNKTGPVFHQGEFRRAWTTACHKVGLGHRTKEKGKGQFPKYTGILIHDLRRSAIWNFREAGVAQSTVMAISGHKTEEVLRRYSINSREDIQRAMQRVHAASKIIDTPNLLAENGESLGRVSELSTAKLLRAHSSVG
jgi:integrase